MPARSRSEEAVCLQEDEGKRQYVCKKQKGRGSVSARSITKGKIQCVFKKQKEKRQCACKRQGEWKRLCVCKRQGKEIEEAVCMRKQKVREEAQIKGKRHRAFKKLKKGRRQCVRKERGSVFARSREKGKEAGCL